jgi:hypothetical protein
MSVPTFPSQQGSQKALQIPAPIFASYTVLDKTWKEKDNTTMKDYKNGASQTVLSTFTDPGIDATCTVIVNTGAALLVKGMSITPTTDTVATPRAMLVVDVDNAEFGGDVVEQQLKLRFKVAQTGLT